MPASTREQQRVARERARQRGLMSDDPRHGSLHAYNYFGCRCPRCSFAAHNRGKKYRYSTGAVPFGGLVRSSATF